MNQGVDTMKHTTFIAMIAGMTISHTAGAQHESPVVLIPATSPEHVLVSPREHVIPPGARVPTVFPYVQPEPGSVLEPVFVQIPIEPKLLVSQVPTPSIEVVFVLDTTGSMGGLIESAKQKIWSIASMMSTGNPAPKIRIGLVGYRDRSDDYTTTIVPMTDDLDVVYARLTEFTASGGGDTPESVNEALATAVNTTPWTERDSVLRIIYLVGDAPPHMDYQDDVKYPASCEQAARNGIIINTIQCGSISDTTPIWKEIARSAEGEYFAIEQSGGVVTIDTPFDSDLAKLGLDLRSINLYYGDETVNMRQLAKEEASAQSDTEIAARPAAAAERAAYLASSAGASSLGAEQELIRDIADGTITLADIKDEELPERLRTMNETERETYVHEQIQRRSQIMVKIQALTIQRAQFMKTELAKTGARSSFDASVLAAIRKQAVRAGIEYKDLPSGPSEGDGDK